MPRAALDNKRHIDAYSRSREWDRGIAALAARQHGVVARWQLVPPGLTRDAIRRRLEAGRLHRVHRGVYAVGHDALTQRGRWMAGVLACGPGAVLSHRAAAALWGIRHARVVEVTAAKERRHAGIRSHIAIVPPDERTTVDGIGVTTVARTLLDLAQVLSARQLGRAFHEAEYRRLTDTVSLDALIARHPGRAGIRDLPRTGAPRLIRSDLEHDFLAFLDDHELPRPASNISVEGLECDAVYEDERLIVELDSRAAHDTASAFEEDRARDRALAVAGWRVIRVTWRMLREEPERLAADLRRLLRRA